MTDEQLEILLRESTGEQIRFGKGWYSLVKDLYAELVEAGWDKKFSCAKEKYGHLAFYLATYDPVLEKIIEKYQRLSALTCEDCGMPGRTMSLGGWDKTICANHFLEWRKNIQKEYLNYRGLGSCEICGYISVLNGTCLSCNNDQWNPSDHEFMWTKEERIKTYQLSWYSYIENVPANEVSLFPADESHQLYFTKDELDSHVEYTEYDF